MSPAIKAFICLAAAHAMVDCCALVWSIFKNLVGLNLARAGLLQFIGMFIASLMQPVFGALSDHGMRRRLVVLGIALASCTMLLGPVSMTGDFMHGPAGYATMFFVIMFAWLGVSMFHPPAVTLAGETFSGRRSTAVALFIACGMTGMASSHLFFSFAFRRLNGHTEVLLIPAAMIVAWVWWWCRVPQKRCDGSLGLRSMASQVAQLPRRLFPLWLMQVSVAAHHQGMIFLMPEFATHRGYDDVFVRGGLFAALIAGSAVMMLPVGHLADRIGRRRVMFLGLMTSLPLHLLLVLTPRMPAAGCVVILFLIGGFAASMTPVGIAHGQALVPRQASLITGFLMGFAWAAASPTPWIVGTLAGRPSLGPVGAVAWLAVALLIGCVSAFFVPGSLEAAPSGRDGSPE